MPQQGGPSGNGIGGGGLIRTDSGGEANFSLLATSTPDPAEPNAPLTQGQILWADSSWAGIGLQLASRRITGYWWTEGVEGGRSVAGWMNAGVVEPMVPFFLQAVDAGRPGSGQDTVRLLVGRAIPAEVMGDTTPTPSDFSYTFEGTLESGDLMLLTLKMDGGDETMPTTPTP